MIDTITTYLLSVLAFPTAFWLVMYLVPQIYMAVIRPVPDLKKRYHASWGELVNCILYSMICNEVWLLNTDVLLFFAAHTIIQYNTSKIKALVTGSGSGIGKAIAFKLASQGLNVVLVSIDDEHLKVMSYSEATRECLVCHLWNIIVSHIDLCDLQATVKQLKEKFPELEFRAVGCTFSPGVDYLKQIDEATKDITIQCIFNNAGFIVTGFVDQTPLPK